MKNVLGGDGSGGGSGAMCLTSACTLTVKTSNGTYETRNGNCALHTEIIIPGPYPVVDTKCYCDAGLGYDYDLSSNGGVSRCTA